MKSLQIYNLLKPLYELDNSIMPEFLIFNDNKKSCEMWSLGSSITLTDEMLLLIMEGHLTNWCINKYDAQLKFSIGTDGQYYPRHEIEIGDDHNTSEWFCGTNLLDVLVDCANELIKKRIRLNMNSIQTQLDISLERKEVYANHFVEVEKKDYKCQECKDFGFVASGANVMMIPCRVCSKERLV